jgi:hypothetical protein
MSATSAAERPLPGLERRVPIGRLARILPVVAPVAALTGLMAAIATTMIVQDSWSSLVAGREIAEHGLPRVEHLTAMASGRGWVDQQWLAQVVMYAVSSVGGLGGLLALHIVLTAGAFGFAALAAHERGARPGVLAVFVFLAAGAAPWGYQLRAQAFALFLFSVTLWLLARDVRVERNSTLAVLPILGLWANLHGSVVLGASLVAAYGVQALVDRPRGGRLLRAAACVVLAPAAVLASPYAFQLPAYYKLMLVDPPFGREIMEWQRSTPSASTAVFFTLLSVVVVLAARRRRDLTRFDVLALLITIASALAAMRGIVWFALTALAVVPALATRKHRSEDFSGAAAGALAAVMIASALGAIVWTAARPASAYPGDLYPPGVASAVRAHAGGGRVFANDGTADWLLWEIPALRGRVAYDVRFELLKPAEMARIVRYVRLEGNWTAALRGYGLVVADPRHAARLVRTEHWRRVYSSQDLSVVRRVS